LRRLSPALALGCPRKLENFGLENFENFGLDNFEIFGLENLCGNPSYHIGFHPVNTF